jgi:hypothetical protein
LTIENNYCHGETENVIAFDLIEVRDKDLSEPQEDQGNRHQSRETWELKVQKTQLRLGQ